MFFKYSTLAVFVVFGIVCISGDLSAYLPKPRLDGRIVGGFPMNITQVPWQVSLQLRGSHFCGGSIIGETWILTAAHCTNVLNNNAKSVMVRTGSTIHDKHGVLIGVKRIVQNKKFNNRNVDYDYSLLELDEPLTFDETTQPIALPDFGEDVADGSMCLVTGWGNTQNSSESRLNLRGAEVPIVNQVKCNAAYSSYGGVTPRMICAGFEKGGKDACQGDSGGPLVCNDKIFGIVSWGYGCAKPNYPGIYSRVKVAREWILENSGI